MPFDTHCSERPIQARERNQSQTLRPSERRGHNPGSILSHPSLGTVSMGEVMTEQRLAAAQDSVAPAGFSISSQVLPGLVAALDTLAIWSVALISFSALVGGYPDESEQYITTICFVWLVAMMLMHF